jgi:hypothetical protein
MRTFISSLIILFVFSVAGMAAQHGAPQNPHDPANPHNPVQQAHEQAHQQAMQQHQQAMEQAMEQHTRDHNNAVELHRQAHEQAVRNARCCTGTDPNSTTQWHELRPERRGSSLADRIRTWRENRREARESQD